MVDITGWLFLIIPGLVYVFALFLAIARVYDLKAIKSIRDYLPYIAIIVVFFSFIVGLGCHLALERILFCSGLSTKSNVLVSNANISDRRYGSICDTYATLVMLRHLIISIFVLACLSFRALYKNTNSGLKWYVFFACIIFEFILSLAYLFQKGMVQSINSAS